MESQEMELLTVPEVAAELRISVDSAYALIRKKQLPSVRLGRSVRIPRGELRAWLRANTTGSVTEEG